MNYATFDPTELGAMLELEQSGTVLAVIDTADINRTALAIQPQATGRWYAELLVYGTGDLLASLGIAQDAASLATYVGGDANGYGYRMADGEIHNAGASVAGVTAGAKGDIIGLLLDLTTSVPTVGWYRNGQSLKTLPLDSTGPWMLAASLGGSEAYGLRCFLNAGQRAFEFAPDGVQGWFEPPPSLRGLKLASEDWLSDPADEVPNARYDGLLNGQDNELRAVRSLDFWPWQRGVKSGAMVLSALDAEGTFAELLSSDARDMPVRIGQITRGQTYADRVNLFSAVIDNVTAVDDLQVKLTCRDPLALLAVPLQRRLIRPDADPSSANQPWPILLGACRNVPCVLMDATTYTYAVADTPLLGVGFGRDSGYPYDPAATPPDFTLSATKTNIVLHAQPQGVVTVDASSVGGQQLPTPGDDILGGAGAPFTGDDGDTPTGWDDVGGDVPQATPVMNSGVLEFPLVQVAPTIYAKVPVYTSGAVGSIALELDWIDDAGNVVGSMTSVSVTGSHAWADVELIDTAPANAVTGRLRTPTNNHTAGVIRVGAIQAYYVRYGDHDAIDLQNPSFENDMDGWSSTSPSWQIVEGKAWSGSKSIKYNGGAGSRCTNAGVAPVTAGQRISASCRISLDKPEGTNPYGALRITWLDGGNHEIGSSRSGSITHGDQGNFDLCSVSGTAPAAGYAVIELEAGNGNGGEAGALFDAVQWDFVLEPAGGVRTLIDLGDLTQADRWQLGQNWTLQPAGANGPDGAAYAEHAPGPPGASTALVAVRAANVRQAVSYLGWAGISTAKIGAGKSYKVQITIPSLPADGMTYIALATGTTIDSALASWNKAGTYEVTITNTDGVDHSLYLLSIPLSAGGSIVPVPPQVSDIQVMTYDDTYTPDPRDTTPATLQAIKLADYLHEVLDVRGAQAGVQWSLEDAQAIDAATGYAGLGVYLDGGETIAQALDMALASYTACKWADGAGKLRFTRLIDPASVAAGDRAGTIELNAMGGDLVPALDTAPGLTTQMGVRRNWASFSDGDLVEASENFPLAVRQSMLRDYQQVASTATPLAGAYRHALYAAPVASCFDQQADGQAEIDRVAALYSVPRWFYAVPVELEALPGIDLGQVWTLVYPKYGLAAGKPVLVIDFEPDLLANTANIILWG